MTEFTSLGALEAAITFDFYSVGGSLGRKVRKEGMHQSIVDLWQELPGTIGI